jgi:hypothetical protein
MFTAVEVPPQIASPIVIHEMAVRAQFLDVSVFVVAAVSVYVMVMKYAGLFTPSAAHAVLDRREPLFRLLKRLSFLAPIGAAREHAQAKLSVFLSVTLVGAHFRAEPTVSLSWTSMELRSAALALLNHRSYRGSPSVRVCPVETGQRAVTNRRSSFLLMMGATSRAHSGFSAALPPHGATAGARARFATDRAVSCERLMAYNANCGVNGHATYT